MALATALLTRMRVLQAVAESTSGTPGSVAQIANVFDSKIDAQIQPVERDGQGSLAPLAPVPGAYWGKATFKSELVGSGTAATDPTWATVLLTACGVPITSHVAKPLSGSGATATLGLNIAGRQFQIFGAMGKFTLNAENGKPAIFDWEFDGVWTPPTGVTLPTGPTFTTIPPRVAACTFTIGGTAYQVPKVEFAVDNTLYMRETILADGAGNASGYAACCIVQRKVTIKVAPEALALATKDWFAAHLASTGVAFSMLVGSAAGNEFTLAAPNLVLLNPPGEESRSGIYADNLEFLACRNSSTGDDEFSLTIG